MLATALHSGGEHAGGTISRFRNHMASSRLGMCSRNFRTIRPLKILLSKFIAILLADQIFPPQLPDGSPLGNIWLDVSSQPKQGHVSV